MSELADGISVKWIDSCCKPGPSVALAGDGCLPPIDGGVCQSASRGSRAGGGAHRGKRAEEPAAAAGMPVASTVIQSAYNESST